MKRRLPLLLLAPLLLLCGCNEMSRQPRYDHYEPSRLFADGASLQAPAAGAVAIEDEARWDAAQQRPPMSAKLLARGRERFDVFCSPCHGASGAGDGVVPARGFPRPPDLLDERARRLTARQIFDVITNGYGVMYAFQRVPAADRWAIAAYVRALQATNVAAADLSAQERAQMEAAHGR